MLFVNLFLFIFRLCVSVKRRQGIHICYDFVGFIPLDTLMEQETA